MQVFHTDSISERDFKEILKVLETGGVIGFPTDTAYGLGADPFNAAAVARIFEIKGRPEGKPILLLAGSRAIIEQVAIPNAVFEKIAGEFWPGPLTVILTAVKSLPRHLTAGTGTIGVRWPDATFAVELSRRFGKPVTATSANRSGMSAGITAEEVHLQLGDSIQILIDGGSLPVRSGSTLLDLTTDPPVLLREGPVSYNQLRGFLKGRIRKGNA